VVFFQQGIMGWLIMKFPERFGIAVDRSGSRDGGAQ